FSGTAISQTSTTTFTLSEIGHYHVSFVGSSLATSLLGGAVVRLNKTTNVDPAFTLLSAGAPIVLQTVVNITSVPTTLQIVITGLAVTFGSGKSTTIYIQKVSN